MLPPGLLKIPGLPNPPGENGNGICEIGDDGENPPSRDCKGLKAFIAWPITDETLLTIPPTAPPSALPIESVIGFSTLDAIGATMSATAPSAPPMC